MSAKQLFEQGRVREAQKALSAWLRDNPTDRAQRTFLFELLCFSGEYDRAEKQLGVLAKDGGDAELGAVLYYSALHAEKTRHDLFRSEDFPSSEHRSALSGNFNGKSFTTITDADPTIGPRLEVYAAGAYVWIPFEHIASIHAGPPKRLRDTLWMPAYVLTAPSFKGADLGDVLLPAVYPFSWKSDDESVWLGRKTEWVADDRSNEFPVGQKMLLIDGEEAPILELRSLEFASAAAA